MGTSASRCTSGLCFSTSVLIHINDLSRNLSPNTKLFAHDTSIFSVVKNVNVPTDELNSSSVENII